MFQFTSFAQTDCLKRIGIRISMVGKGRCLDNIFIERPWRSMKHECVYLQALETGPQAKVTRKPVSLYGIYMVRPGDNLWNIHFRVLKEYFAHHGIKLSPGADEPGPHGRSSGVGKILKYAERMVYVYNVKTEELTDNLNLLQPGQKIVVFNMTQLDNVLRKLDKENIKRLRLDGQTLQAEF